MIYTEILELKIVKSIYFPFIFLILDLELEVSIMSYVTVTKM